MEISCVDSTRLTTSKFRSERNIYISAYALFLIFVIWRISLFIEQSEGKVQENREASVVATETAVSEPQADEADNEHPKTD